MVAQMQEYGLCHFMGLLSDHLGFICQLMIDNREKRSKIVMVMVKQDPVELEAVMRKFFFVLIGNMEFKSALVFR